MPGKTILIVDDEVKIIELLERLLKAEGFSTVSAATGQDAIAQAKRYHPQLIIMDIMLPDMNGAEAVVAIKEQGLAHAPVIFLSGIAGQQNAGEVKSTIKAGDIVYPAFPKPFEIKEFLTAVRESL